MLKYVVVKSMQELLKQIRKIQQNKNRIIIGIDGPAGAGKSTLAYQLADEFKATIFHMDDYFLTDDLRTPDRLNMPGGNVDYERMHKEIFMHLSDDEIEYKKYNCMTKHFEEEIEPLKKVIIIEGVYSMRPEFQMYYDLSVFVEVEKAVQLARLQKRNARMFKRFVDEWIPMEEKYFSAYNVRNKVDYILK